MNMLGDSFIPEPHGEDRTTVMNLAKEIMDLAKKKGRTPVECAQACYYIQYSMTTAVLKKTTDEIIESAGSKHYGNIKEKK